MKEFASLKIAAPKKAWVMPELKKINIETVTAALFGSGGDSESAQS